MWQSGDNVAYRGVVHGKVWYVEPAKVVLDTPELIVFYLVPGVTCSSTLHLQKTQSRWDITDSGAWELADWVWQRNRVLTFLYPNEYYSIRLFWNHLNNEFICWYVNFQTPFQRSAVGFDTFDLDLDLIVDPEGHWKWKDESEYKAAIARGSISQEEVRGIESVRERVVDMVSARNSPFDGSWNGWLPNPLSPIPELPPSWEKI